MAKDPAVLVYFDKWISSTNGMKAEFRAWYFDLLIYQYDKGIIPNDEDAIAGICRVRPSEYESFKQMLKQVLKQKFKQTDIGWENEVMSDILKKREDFKDKRVLSGNIGVVIKTAKTIKGFTIKYLDILKSELYTKTPNEIEKYKDKQVLEQVLEQMLKLYIDVDVNNSIIVSEPLKNNVEIKEIGGEKIKEIANKVWNDKIWSEQISIANYLKPNELKLWMGQFNASVMNDSILDFDEKKYKKMFGGWLKTQQSKGYKLPQQQKTMVDNLQKI